MTNLIVHQQNENASPQAPQQASQADDDGHLVQLWLHGKSPNSQEAYRRDVEQFIDFVDLPLHLVKLQHLQDWSYHLYDLGLAPATRARKLAAVKSLYTFGHRIGYLVFNVGAAINIPKVPDRLTERILSEPDVQRILALETDLRNGIMLRLFYASGGRVSELAELYWSALQERGDEKGRPIGQVTLLGKGQKTRSILLSADTWEAIEKLKTEALNKEHGSPTDPVFRSRKGGPLSRQQIWRIVKKAAKRAGLSQAVSPHWLRHAHASHALDRGAPTHLVKETLGHKSLATTSKYTHARLDDSSARYLSV